MHGLSMQLLGWFVTYNWIGIANNRPEVGGWGLRLGATAREPEQISWVLPLRVLPTN